MNVLPIQQIHRETNGKVFHLLLQSGVVRQARSGKFAAIAETNQAVGIQQTMLTATVNSERSTDLRFTVLDNGVAAKLSVLGRVH